MNITAKCRSNNLKCGNNNNYYNNYWKRGVAGGGQEKHLNNVEANATTATLSKQTARLSPTEAATGSATASAAAAAALWQRVKA